MAMIPGIDKFFVPITIQRKTTGEDEWGNPTNTYEAIGTLQGVIRQTGGNEPFVSGKDTPISSHRLYCRVTTIEPEDRFLFGGKTYSVKNINDVLNFGELLQIDLEYIG